MLVRDVERMNYNAAHCKTLKLELTAYCLALYCTLAAHRTTLDFTAAHSKKNWNVHWQHILQNFTLLQQT